MYKARIESAKAAAEAAYKQKKQKPLVEQGIISTYELTKGS
ncbi:MAG: hypothetical protein R2779_06730 [Crocinitomicaceae bacterium]